MLFAAASHCSPVIFAQPSIDAAPRMSYLGWMLSSLGWFYGPVLIGAGLLLFLGAVVVVIAARRPSVVAAYLALVPLPLLIGAWAAVTGMIRSFSVVATSDTAPKPSDVAEGISMALFSVMAGLLATIPSFLVTAVGLFVRTLLHRGPREK